LRQICSELADAGIRSSIFIDADPRQGALAAEAGARRVELYTKPYADRFPTDPEEAVAPFVKASTKALELGIGLNAGHDLNLENLAYFHRQLPLLDEVSIGHALISDALYLGIGETIRRYREALSDNI
ncbi:MAG: pyridoxine 5'-phosphate synthase, partial [Muribaculaceae bacterium]|nr:pyridoxine 5'-phosphate synthase [Muribaculaceae bacterium]